MQSIAKHIVTYKNLRLHVTKYGNKPGFPDLLFLHGFMGSGDQFRHLIPELSKFNNPVTVDIIPDFEMMPGYDDLIHENSLVTDPGLMPPPDILSHSDPASVPVLPSNNKVSDSDDRHVTDTEPKLEASLLADGLQKAVSSCLHQRPYVLGYSMGARITLSWAVKYPEHAEGLILESGTAGISAPEARKERREADAILAEKIQSDFPAFLKEWEQNPLFFDKNHNQDNTSDSDPLSNLKTIQQKQNPEHVAHWLTDFGTGTMPPLQEELPHIKCPVLLITGELDRKFSNIAAKMEPLFPDACHQTVPEASHRVHIDAPDAYLALIRDFLPKLSEPDNNEFRQDGI